MRRVIQVVALIVATLILAITASLYPKLENMGAEYATAKAIGDIEAYVRENQGGWPASPQDLEGDYPVGGEVEIDYSALSSELLAEPERLRDAVRPRSGRFYTWPHYDVQLDRLLATLSESDGALTRMRDGAGQGATGEESAPE